MKKNMAYLKVTSLGDVVRIFGVADNKIHCFLFDSLLDLGC